MLHNIENYFCYNKTNDLSKLRVGNSGVPDIVGIGDMVLQTNIGCTLRLKMRDM